MHPVSVTKDLYKYYGRTGLPTPQRVLHNAYAICDVDEVDRYGDDGVPYFLGRVQLGNLLHLGEHLQRKAIYTVTYLN